MSDRQTYVDAFYRANGPCCAGCDWWRHVNSVAGECLKSQIIPGAERFAMLGGYGASLTAEAGHAVTTRDHLCGQFQDQEA